MKAELRRALLAARQGIPAPQRAKESVQVCRRLRNLAAVARADSILGYDPLPQEVDIRPVLGEWAVGGRAVALPRVEGPHLVAREWKPGAALEESRFHLMEPAASARRVDPELIGVVVVPGVAFDAAGNRLGFGRGYYDRFLAQATKAIRVGVCFTQQVVSGLPVEVGDEPMDWLISPGRTIETCRRFV